MESALVLLFSLMLGQSSSAQLLHYVKSNDLSSQDCPGQPCLTLDQYIHDAEEYFISGTEFIFLDGQHTLRRIVNLTNVSDITLTQEDYPQVNLICMSEGVLVFKNVSNVTIKGLVFVSQLDIIRRNPSLLIIVSSRQIRLLNVTFQGNGQLRAIYSNQSLLVVVSCHFEDNTGENGGALYAEHSVIVLNGNNFTQNKAYYDGGAIFALSSSINIFPMENSVDSNNQSLQGNETMLTGYSLTTTFLGNEVLYDGGAIYLENSTLTVSGTSVIFANNSAEYGGAICCRQYSVIYSATKNLQFLNNTARKSGGAIALIESSLFLGRKVSNFISLPDINSDADCHDILPERAKVLNITSNFSHNHALFGGAVFLHNAVAYLSGTRMMSDSNSAEQGGALMLQYSVAVVYNISFSNNMANFSGGAILSLKSCMIIGDYRHNTNHDLSVLSSNKASYDGGAIYGFNGAKFIFNGRTIFDNNIAEGNGGGIYAIYADITFNNTVEFISNSALNGGAMFFEIGAVLTIEQDTNLTTSYNHATEYGSVIYHVDSGATRSQCEYNYKQCICQIPYCFIDLKGVTIYNAEYYFPFNISFYYDSAGKDGSYIYGGFLDKFKMSVYNEDIGMIVYFSVMIFINKFWGFTPRNNRISSRPYQLCFCQNHSDVDCFGNYTVRVNRGQKFNVSLVATAQGDVHITSSTQVTVKLNPTARLDLNQSSQEIKDCSAVTYNVYSTKNYEELVLYPADGPCMDRGFAKAVIEVMLLPCPDGFTQSSEQCVCEERLQAYNADCTIDEVILITKRSINFWMSALYINESYQGLILYEICPIESCKSGNVSISLNDVNIQCDFNHTGILCGACATNYSLLLGSSTCQICSNMYLSLLVPFALAGLSLVIFLTFLRLTVATGLINSLILYANIVQANKSLFFPLNTTNLLTVFIAWMNLDLGFKTCFYDGMDGYAHTWLQFLFPLYVWILVSLIIISSRYSIKVSRLIGSNPVAVLATLLLLSYTKILKIIIEVFSFVKLDYPDNKKVTVWLKDANVPYMEHKHLFLTVATVFIVFLFLSPYTLLLLLGYKLYSFRCCGEYFHIWLMRFRSLLDSYYAPYNIHHQYWTGLMLLVRCALYIVFSYYSIGETNGSLLVVIVVFVPIGFYLGFMQVYKKYYLNIIELVTYLNLLLLSAVTVANIHSLALVYTSVGITFFTFISVCVYHFCIFYTPQKWLNFGARLVEIMKKPKSGTVTEQPLQDMATLPTETIIEAIREPLLEDSITV